MSSFAGKETWQALTGLGAIALIANSIGYKERARAPERRVYEVPAKSFFAGIERVAEAWLRSIASKNLTGMRPFSIAEAYDVLLCEVSLTGAGN